jgi:hypothetical protein
MPDASEGYAPAPDSMWTLYPDVIDSGSAHLASRHRRARNLAHGGYMRCRRSFEDMMILDSILG